jgi:hypothetical protein
MGFMTPPAPANRLARQTSPYLRQHASNPVDWYPWSAEALERARRERRPILLSIGYAACHWCHVMAHESFEDPETARVMNELYVNIKVDREERPDLDRLYQLAHQLLTGRGGGWPLTMFLTPEDQQPFFGGTYFPPQSRFGMPGFRELLAHVARYYREHEAELKHNAATLVQAITELNPPAAAAELVLSGEPLRGCRAALERSLDPEWGGFGAAPKFPHAELVLRLLRDWHSSAGDAAPDLQALYMATLSLTRMAEGGLFDQLAGGFSRYSVDERWAIPHFEKMLYDNAALLGAYAEAACATGDPLFAEICARTVGWLMSEMRAPSGAFFASLDADSEGHEGKFYVWDVEEVRATLSPEEFAAFAPRYGLDQPPNFENRAHHLLIARALEPLADELGRSIEELQGLCASARAKLLAVRAGRVRPARDEKILTSWNALLIRGLASASRLLQRAEYAVAAGEALRYLRTYHWRAGRLLVTGIEGGEAALEAYLDDYVFLAAAILELACVRFDAEELALGAQLLDVVLARFGATDGGFYFTASDHETLISRLKTFSDDALPAGNGVAAQTLLRYGYLLGEPRYLVAAEACLRAGWQVLEKYPEGHCSMLLALEEWLRPPQIVILRGPVAAMAAWQQALAGVYSPHTLVLAVPADARDLPEALHSKPATAHLVAYLCRGSVCSQPLTTLEALAAALAEASPERSAQS